MTVALIAPILPRLAKLLPLLGSDQPGEVTATAAAIGRLLGTVGASWHDLAGALAKSGERASAPFSDAFAAAMAERFRKGRKPRRASERQAAEWKQPAPRPPEQREGAPTFRTMWQAIDHTLDADRSMPIEDRARLIRIRAQLYGHPHRGLPTLDAAWLAKRWGMQRSTPTPSDRHRRSHERSTP